MERSIHDCRASQSNQRAGDGIPPSDQTGRAGARRSGRRTESVECRRPTKCARNLHAIGRSGSVGRFSGRQSWRTGRHVVFEGHEQRNRDCQPCVRLAVRPDGRASRGAVRRHRRQHPARCLAQGVGRPWLGVGSSGHDADQHSEEQEQQSSVQGVHHAVTRLRRDQHRPSTRMHGATGNGAQRRKAASGRVVHSPFSLAAITERFAWTSAVDNHPRLAIADQSKAPGLAEGGSMVHPRECASTGQAPAGALAGSSARNIAARDPRRRRSRCVRRRR